MGGTSPWRLLLYDELARTSKRLKLQKKHPVELTNVYANLQRVKEALEEGIPLSQVTKLGFLHNEGKGLWAVDQKGPNRPQKQLRLYIYFERPSQTIHVFRIGDKSTQRADIRACYQLIDQLRN